MSLSTTSKCDLLDIHRVWGRNEACRRRRKEAIDQLLSLASKILPSLGGLGDDLRKEIAQIALVGPPCGRRSAQIGYREGYCSTDGVIQRNWKSAST